MEDDKKKIQWHGAFRSAMELTLIKDDGALAYDDEYHLNRKSLKVDLLIIKDNPDSHISEEIGRIFSRYNILEYKSPGDSLSIDTYYKVVAYGCLLKIQKTHSINAVSREDITLTIIRNEKPVKLFLSLKKENIRISSNYPGIYRLGGNILFETQIIVTKELPLEKYIWLKVLARDLDRTTADQFVNGIAELPEGRERNLADDILQTSMSANYEIFKKLREEDPIMVDALRQLMKPEIDEAIENATKQVTEQVTQQVTQQVTAQTELSKLKSLMAKTGWSAEEAMDALEIEADKRKTYAERLP